MNKRGKKNFSLGEQYKLSWKYLNESRNFIYITIALFIIFILIGYFAPVPEWFSETILEMIQELIAQTEGMSAGELTWFIFSNNLLASFKGLTYGMFLQLPSILFTMVNGFILGFVSLISVEQAGLGIVWQLVPHGIFELPAIFIAFGMGIKLGEFFFSAKNKLGAFLYLLTSTGVFLGLILIYFISIGMVIGLDSVAIEGIKSLADNQFLSLVPMLIFLASFVVTRKILENKDRKELVRRVRESFRVFLYIVVPLLVVAAIIEGILIAFLS